MSTIRMLFISMLLGFLTTSCKDKKSSGVFLDSMSDLRLVSKNGQAYNFSGKTKIHLISSINDGGESEKISGKNYILYGCISLDIVNHNSGLLVQSLPCYLNYSHEEKLCELSIVVNSDRGYQGFETSEHRFEVDDAMVKFIRLLRQ